MALIGRVQEIIEAVRREHAPDPRLAVYEVAVEREASALVLYGATSVPAAAESLHRKVEALESGYEIRDRLTRLPVSMGRGAHAVVRAPLAPMLAGPWISESHLSQVLLGHRLLVLREHGRWLQCRALDGYIGWIHRGYLARRQETEARAWEVGVDAPVHLSLGAEVVDEAGEVMVRLPWGARVGVAGEQALLPDGRWGRLQGRTAALAERGTLFPLEAAAVISTALEWLGAPYLWGGTTPWGVDCSGFVQAVFRMHGVELPRDSDQQARLGGEVEVGTDLEGVEPGDLLFFAERADRISHVALSLGGSQLVHSAVGNGGVRRNDLLGSPGYERELRTLLVGVRRVTGVGGRGAGPGDGAE